VIGVVVAVATGFCFAQFRRGGGGFWAGDDGAEVRSEGGDAVNEDTVRTARQTASHSTETPTWTNTPGFEKDVFTFTRVVFRSGVGERGSVPPWVGWLNDYPDSDLNLSWRLQQLTAVKTDPDGRVVRLTDPDLPEFPWTFMAKPGRISLRDAEIPRLRQYLLSGGVLMADDFWGDREWETFEAQMKRVLPERSWVELPMEHPLFHCVFDLQVPKNGLQVPSIRFFNRATGQMPPRERFPDMHVRAWLDDKQRVMIIATHNCDSGDGWEREGENEVYFRDYSEKRAYPLAINLLFYVMTH
jgi:hypothetical protein